MKPNIFLRNWFVSLTTGLWGAIIFWTRNLEVFPLIVLVLVIIIALHNYAQGYYRGKL